MSMLVDDDTFDLICKECKKLEDEVARLRAERDEERAGRAQASRDWLAEQNRASKYAAQLVAEREGVKRYSEKWRQAEAEVERLRALLTQDHGACVERWTQAEAKLKAVVEAGERELKPQLARMSNVLLGLWRRDPTIGSMNHVYSTAEWDVALAAAKEKP